MSAQVRPASSQIAALQLHISLDVIEPPIWRRLWVEDTITLGRLHEVLQITMGWQNVHLHQFMLGEHRTDQIVYTPPWEDGFDDPEFTKHQRDETRVKARSILRVVGDVVAYKYNMGDN